MIPHSKLAMELLSSLHSALLAPVQHGLRDWLVVTPGDTASSQSLTSSQHIVLKPTEVDHGPTSPHKNVGRLPNWSSSDWSQLPSWTSRDRNASSAVEEASAAGEGAQLKSSLRSPKQRGKQVSAASRRVSFATSLEIGPSLPSRGPPSVHVAPDCSSAGDLARMHTRQVRYAQQRRSLSDASRPGLFFTL